MSEAEHDAAGSRYVVGIDLGTTNSALAFVDTREGDQGEIRTLEIAQLTSPGTVERRTLLPSFLYFPRQGEVAEESVRLPWDTSGKDGIVGVLAARRAAEAPDRVVSSAKSWLCHAGVDRLAPILPWSGEGAETEVRRCSPLDASRIYLEHLRAAWNAEIAHGDPEAALERQDVYLTVPASFDAAARELTVRAAETAGLAHVHLLEEPQAALYAWLQANGDGWRDQLRAGDIVLVCDVGGGTTDFSAVVVEDDGGDLSLRRVAVGDHILLGGDNMDLALALGIRERLAREGQRLDGWQLRSLVSSCREAKESLLGSDPPESVPLVVLGRGKKLIGSTIRTELERSEVGRILLDGFFPAVEAGARVTSDSSAGLAEIGLPFASDPAVTRHLATFLSNPRDGDVLRPTAVLFNGGVMAAAALRQRVGDVLASWASAEGRDAPRVLQGGDLAHAVARGGAYFGLARRGHGLRIRGGTARSYYVGIASAMPAVPGHLPPVKSICVVPFGIEEGSALDVPGAELGLRVGGSATFRFFSSSTRADDALGAVLDEWETADLDELAPLRVSLDGPGEGRVPVRLRAIVSEIGTLELYFVARDGSQRWRLEFNVRETGSVS